MARTFTDRNGLEWSILIGLYTANRVRNLSDGRVDFVDTSRVQSARNALIEMAEDVELCGRVLWWLCEDQATERGIDEKAFADAFDLDVLEAAQMAVAEAIIDFFPNRARPALHHAVEIAREATTAAMLELDEVTTDLVNSPEFEQMVQGAIRGAMSGNSPDLRAADPVNYSIAAPN